MSKIYFLLIEILQKQFSALLFEVLNTVENEYDELIICHASPKTNQTFLTIMIRPVTFVNFRTFC